MIHFYFYCRWWHFTMSNVWRQNCLFLSILTIIMNIEQCISYRLKCWKTVLIIHKGNISTTNPYNLCVHTKNDKELLRLAGFIVGGNSPPTTEWVADQKTSDSISTPDFLSRAGGENTAPASSSFQVTRILIDSSNCVHCLLCQTRF